MEEDNHPQVDVPPAGSQTPAQQASDIRNGTVPSQNDDFSNGPSRSPQTAPTTGTTAAPGVTNAQLGDAVRNSMLQQGMVIDAPILPHPSVPHHYFTPPPQYPTSTLPHPIIPHPPQYPTPMIPHLHNTPPPLYPTCHYTPPAIIPHLHYTPPL